MTKKFIVYSLITITLAAGIFGITKIKTKKVPIVKTSTAEVGNVKAYLSTTAAVKSKSRKEYYSLQSKVQKVNVKVGDKVKKGDVLVTYETVDISSQVEQAKIQYQNAVLQRTDLYNQNEEISERIAELNSQILELENNTDYQDKTKLQTLYQQRNSLKSISQEKLKQADNGVKLAKISLDTIKQKASKNNGIIAAESDGVVTELKVVEGAVGNVMQPAVVVQDIENLKSVVFLGKYDADKVKLGQEVIIRGGNNEYKGKISFINPAAQKVASLSGNETTLGMEIDILEKSPELKIDFDVDVDILIGSVKDIIKVPAESVKTVKRNENFVYVLEGNTVQERSVTTGLQSEIEVEIKEGIKEGEKVILNPSTSIVDGVKVKEYVEES